MQHQHPMFRRRSGTGGLYADNRGRSESAERWRGARRSRLPRVPTSGRLWGQSAHDGDRIRFDLGGLVHRAAQVATEMLGLLRDVGEEVTWCGRRRVPLTADFLREMSELLDWYIVLHTIGLLDRRGVWVGPPLLPPEGLAVPPESR